MQVESQAQRRFMFALRHDPSALGDVARSYISGASKGAFAGLPEHVRSSPDLRGQYRQPPAPAPKTGQSWDEILQAARGGVPDLTKPVAPADMSPNAPWSGPSDPEAAALAYMNALDAQRQAMTHMDSLGATSSPDYRTQILQSIMNEQQ